MGKERTSHESTPRKRQGASLEITSFFTKLPKESRPGSPRASTSSNGIVAATGRDFETSNQAKDTAGTAIPVSENDIGLYVNCADIPDDVKDRAYSKVWTPPSDYEFEPSVSKDGKRRKFQHHWLQRYKWLAFSDVQSGAFCKTCVLFHAKAEAGKGSHQPCKSLVTTPFTKWKHAIEAFESHSQTDYHKRATIDAQNFLDVMRGKVDSVHMQLNQQAKDIFQDSKAKLRAIVETIVLCGRQDIALRGDKDSGRLTLEEPVNNDGNFRALLRYRANGGDTVLVYHIQTAKNNALYSSPRVQNEIISIIGKLIQDNIVREVSKAVFFSVLADETSDISQTEQFSLCVRFVDPDTLCIREDFLSFVAVEDVSASSLANTLKSELVKLGLQLEHLRGQGYDGAAVMSGSFRGVQVIIREEFPTALYTHCSSHSLNLCLSDASKVKDIQRAFGTVKEVCAFFRGSPKREAP